MRALQRCEARADGHPLKTACSTLTSWHWYWMRHTFKWEDAFMPKSMLWLSLLQELVLQSVLQARYLRRF